MFSDNAPSIPDQPPVNPPSPDDRVQIGPMDV